MMYRLGSSRLNVDAVAGLGPGLEADVVPPPPDALLPVADAVVGADSCEPRFAGAFMTYGPVPSEAAYQRSTVGGSLGGLQSLLPSAVGLRCGLFALY